MIEGDRCEDGDVTSRHASGLAHVKRSSSALGEFRHCNSIESCAIYLAQYAYLLFLSQVQDLWLLQSVACFVARHRSPASDDVGLRRDYVLFSSNLLIECVMMIQECGLYSALYPTFTPCHSISEKRFR
jgi:hypothetical protein